MKLKMAARFIENNENSQERTLHSIRNQLEIDSEKRFQVDYFVLFRT